MKGTLFTAGRIYTLDPAPPVVEALAVSAGRIVARGRTTDLAADFPEFDRVDFGDSTVLPGFVDSHIHLASYGISLRRVELRDARALSDAVGRVATAAGRTRRGDWIQGRGWDKNLWPEDRFPSRVDLDPITPGHPVALASKDGHSLWVNSAALALAGIDHRTPDPPGGVIERDDDGHPIGVLKEEAQQLIFRIVPPAGPQTIEDGVRDASALLHSFGIVGVHNFEGPDVFAALQRLAANDRLRVRVWNAIPEDALSAAVSCGLRTGFGNTWLRVGPVKVFSDGALGSQTASMLEPYEGRPQNHGVAVRERDELADLVGRAVAGGFWCAIHAIGDRANRWVLEAYERHAPASDQLGARHRIEHVQVLHPEDLTRPARRHVIASMQPIHCTADRDMADRYWGSRSRYAYAWRSLLDAGTHLAFGSDAPVETADVRQGLYAAVARRRPGQRAADALYPQEAITIDEAVRAYTVGAAFASGAETDAGTLSVGKRADFVVVERDPLTAPVDDLLQMRVLATIVGGETVYAAGV